MKVAQAATAATDAMVTAVPLCVCFWLYRHPVQYIIGEWDFRTLTLDLKPPSLIPRSETEVCAYG